MTQVKFKKLHPKARTPQYMSAGAAGMDIYSVEDVKLLPEHHIAKVRSGLSFAIPDGYEIQVRPRSGLAAEGVLLRNAPGTIDSDYRGEVLVLLSCYHGMELPAGTRIAQLVLQRTPRMELVEVVSLDKTERGGGGFGSSGK